MIRYRVATDYIPLLYVSYLWQSTGDWNFTPLALPRRFLSSPTPASRLANACLFSVPVELCFRSVMCVHLSCFLDSTYMGNYTVLSFSAWLISLSIILSRCIHVVADGKILVFSQLNNIRLQDILKLLKGFQCGGSWGPVMLRSAPQTLTGVQRICCCC